MAENRERKEDEESKPKLPGPQAIGWVLVLLILAGYFLWMTMEMGTAAVSGAAPMIAFLGAAAVGIAAAGLAMVLGRRRKD
jgi:apolipoprotein N-acyltransferase